MAIAAYLAFEPDDADAARSIACGPSQHFADPAMVIHDIAAIDDRILKISYDLLEWRARFADRQDLILCTGRHG